MPIPMPIPSMVHPRYLEIRYRQIESVWTGAVRYRQPEDDIDAPHWYESAELRQVVDLARGDYPGIALQVKRAD